MIDFMISILAVCGFSYLMVDSDIFTKYRDILSEKSSFFEGLFQCYYCSGLYSGIIVYLLGWLEGSHNFSAFSLIKFSVASIIISGVFEEFRDNSSSIRLGIFETLKRFPIKRRPIAKKIENMDQKVVNN